MLRTAWGDCVTTVPETTELRSGWAAIAARVVLSNLPFALALLAAPYLPDFAMALVVGGAMYLAPGLAWADWRKGDAFVVIFRAVAASLLLALACWLVLLAAPGPLSRIGFIIGLALLTNLGLWIGYRRGWYKANPFTAPMARPLLIVAALFFLQSYLGAAHFVPALEDQDMETQGTAYGIMNHAEPTMPINRPEGVGDAFFFAHPLLLHFWIGESALISDDLGRLEYYHEGSLRAQAAPEQTIAIWEEAFAQFLADPVLIESRTPNIFLGAFMLLGLGFIVFRLTGSRIATLAACVVYATLPEAYVRHAYGGYMAITNFFLIGGAYFYLQALGLFADQVSDGRTRAQGRRGAAAAMLMGAWSDQKAMLLPLAASAHAGLRLLLDLPFLRDLWAQARSGKMLEALRAIFSRTDVLAVVVIVGAFFLGWLSYLAYGLAIEPEAFIRDHIQQHITERVNNSGINWLGNEHWYPSVFGLWVEFIDHTGPLIIAAGVLAGFFGIARLRGAPGLFFLWCVLAAVAFSLVDWRHTKHLAHFLPALAALIAVYWSTLEGRMRWIVGGAIVAGVAWNVVRIILTMQDFTYIDPTPIW